MEEYVRALRGLRKTEADLARRAAWNQIRLAGARAGTRPREVLATLNLMFRLGKPPKSRLWARTTGSSSRPRCGGPPIARSAC